jgi:hypothetical protein
MITSRQPDAGTTLHHFPFHVRDWILVLVGSVVALTSTRFLALYDSINHIPPTTHHPCTLTNHRKASNQLNSILTAFYRTLTLLY